MSPSGSPTWSEAGDETKRRHVDRGERRSEERSKKKKREKRDRSDDRSERRHRRDDKDEKGKGGRSSRSRRSPSRSPVHSSPEKQPSSSRRRDERSRERSHGSKRSQRSGESKKKHDSRHRKRSRERERARSRSRSEEKNNGVGSGAEGGGGGGDGKGQKGSSRSRSAERRKGSEDNDKAFGFPPGRVNSFDAALKRSESRDREEPRGSSPSGGEGRKRVRRRSPDKGSREDIQVPMFPGVGMGFFPRGFMPPGEFGWGHGMMPMEGPMPPFFRGGRGEPQIMRGGARPPRGGRGSFRGDREMMGMGRGGRWQQGGRGFDGGPRGRFAGRGWQGRGPPGPNWDDIPMVGASGFGGPAPPPHGIYGPPPTGPMPPPQTQAPPSQLKDGHPQADGVLLYASQGPMPLNGGAAPDGLRVSPAGVPGGPGGMSQRGVEGGGPSMGSADTEPGMQQRSSPHGPRRRGLPHGGPGAGFEPPYMAGDGRMMPPPHGTQKHGRPNAAAHDHKQKHAPDEHSRGRRGPMQGEVVGGNGAERQHGLKRAHVAEMDLRRKQPHVDELRGKEAGRAEKQQQQQPKERQLLKTEAAGLKTEDTHAAAPEAQVKTEVLSSEEKARREEQLKAEQERVEGYLGVAYTLRGISVPASLAGRQLARAVRLLKRRGLEFDRWCREGEKDGEVRSVLTLLMEGDEGHAEDGEEEEDAVYLSGHDEEAGGEGGGGVSGGEYSLAAESAHGGGHAHDVAGGGGDALYGDMEGGDMGDLYGDLEEEEAHAAKREDPTRIIADLNALRAPIIHEPTMTMLEADRLQRLFVDVSQALQAQAVG